MFSPSVSQTAATPSGSVRSSRRRQRPLSNEGSIIQPKAKRQRSALSEQTFVPPDGTPEMEEIKSHKIAKREVSREITGLRREITVRGRKPKSGDRGSKGDGTLTLTENDTYSVSKLPALPDRLRTDVTARQHGAVYSDTGYAITLTHSHAIVWPYAVTVPSPETFTFALPYPSKHVSDPLPLGSLVSASASSAEPGLVVVIPSTGKITYWESIASAATLDLIRQQRNGVELTIPGMYSGEIVVQILNAESAGFVLAFSTGRLAYMSVRDGQGRPGISVQYLRNIKPSSGGILGSLRNVLGSYGSQGDVVAVRAGRPEKVGERNVVVATGKGKIQSWNIHRGGHTSLQAEFDGRERMVEAIKEAQPGLQDLLLESFEILDFTFPPKSVADTQLSDGNEGVHLLVLASLTGRQMSHYSLIELFLAHEKFLVVSIRPIKSYTTPAARNAISNPRLYLPNPALVAYVVFDQAVVVISMAKQPDSPESQLRNESHLLPLTFEDVVDFHGDMNVEIVGSGMEEPHGPTHGIEDSKSHRYKAKHPALILLVRGGGVVRIAATNLGKLTSSTAQQVTVKSKLEQAVFFGTLERNPLNFAVRPELQFSPEEVGAAALELSLEILRSSAPKISSIASIEMNLRQRSASLQHLAEYLKNTGVLLDRATRWRLLWNAEKMEAAASIWSRYDASLKLKPEGQKRGLLTDIVESIHEDYKHNPVSEAGELDRVRTWFINDIWNLEIAVPWGYQAFKHIYQDGQNDHSALLQTISEANDVVIGALQSALHFRTSNLDLYGLQDEQLEHGILTTNYEGLPEFWTSTFFITTNVRKQTELAGHLVKEFWKKSAKAGGSINLNILEKTRLDNPSLVDLAIRSSTERIRWLSAQNSPEEQMDAEQLRMLLATSEDEHITLLATDLDLGDDAIDIAEKHQIMPTLAAVIMIEANKCASIMNRVGVDSEEFDYAATRENQLETRVSQYFDKFGANWATALYEYDIESGGLFNLLNTYQDRQDFLTAFLRSKPEYAKIAWIQEVTREQNFDRAAQTLLDLGLKREQDLWSKKTELSLGKLARMAGRNYSQANGFLIPDGGQTELMATGDQLRLIQIQDSIYNHVFPSIEAAIDDKAEVQLALESHGNKSLKNQKAFSAFLEENMGHLIRHESMDASSLIDLLTLMNGGDGGSQDPTDFRSQQFFLALQVSRYGISSKEERNLIQRVIWRRCMLKDNWAGVNDTDAKDDEEVNDRLRSTALYLTLRACLKNRVFDSDSSIKPISPQEVLGACIEELPDRFNGLDISVREGILKGMQTEDKALLRYVETSRLEKWFQSALDLAKEDFTEEVDEETDDGKKMRDAAQALERIEKQIMENERSSAQKALHRGKIDGTGKFRNSNPLRF